MYLSKTKHSQRVFVTLSVGLRKAPRPDANAVCWAVAWSPALVDTVMNQLLAALWPSNERWRSLWKDFSYGAEDQCESVARRGGCSGSLIEWINYFTVVGGMSDGAYRDMRWCGRRCRGPTPLCFKVFFKVKNHQTLVEKKQHFPLPQTFAVFQSLLPAHIEYLQLSASSLPPHTRASLWTPPPPPSPGTERRRKGNEQQEF